MSTGVGSIRRRGFPILGFSLTVKAALPVLLLGCGRSPEIGKPAMSSQPVVSQTDSTDAADRTRTAVSESEGDTLPVSSTNEDTAKTIVHMPRGEAAARPPGNGCPNQITDDVELHIFSKPQKDLSKLRAMLENDGFVVNFTDMENPPLIAVSGSPAMFRRVFGVKLKLEMSALSARPGFRCALQVTSFRIPNRYKKSVSAIAPPDPQRY